MPFFGYASSKTPWPIFKKIGTVDYVGDPTPQASFWVNRFKGTCLRMREIVTLGRLFFSFFNGSCASIQVRPLDRSSLLTAQMTRPRGVHVLFMVWLIKKLFFPTSTQKCEKLHYTLWELRTAITLASLKICTSCLHQTGGFRGRAIEWCHSNLPQTDPCAMATNRSYFNTKLAITRLK